VLNKRPSPTCPVDGFLPLRDERHGPIKAGASTGTGSHLTAPSSPRQATGRQGHTDSGRQARERRDSGRQSTRPEHNPVNWHCLIWINTRRYCIARASAPMIASVHGCGQDFPRELRGVPGGSGQNYRAIRQGAVAVVRRRMVETGGSSRSPTAP
jgi:hypothetical protein